MENLDWDQILNPLQLRPLSNFPFFIRNKKILLIGAGGGGDSCGCLPVYYWLRNLGAIPIIGSLTWERTVVFQGYGPRPFRELENLDAIRGTVGWGSGKTAIKKDGTRFQASKLASILGEAIIFLDITQGAPTLARDLKEFVDQENIAMVVAIDVGGDIIARGIEPGLQSPLADAIVLATLVQLHHPKLLGIFGSNCDGELSLVELDEYFMEFSKNGWYLGCRMHPEPEIRYMERIIKESGAVTEASLQPIRYLNGERGEVTIRNGNRHLLLEPEITYTYFFQPDEIYKSCPIAQKIATCSSIEQANRVLLEEMNIISEFERERRNLE
jgi:hypothetical protein